MPLRHKIAAETTISTTFFARLHAKGIPFMASIAYFLTFFLRKSAVFAFGGAFSLQMVQNYHP
jgi:hypothetical protein